MANPNPKTPGRMNSSSGQIIIQCPSCKTRFAIESGQVEKAKAPKFHCSKCDHVFGLESAGLKSTDPKSVEPGARSAQMRAAKTPVPPWEQKQPSRSLQMPGKLEPGTPLKAPREKIPEGENETVKPGSQLPLGFQAGADTGSQNVKSQSLRFGEESDTLQPGDPFPGQVDNLRDAVKNRHVPANTVEVSFKDILPPSKEVRPSSPPLPGRQRSRWSGALMLGFPLVLFLLVLGVGGLFLRNNPDVALSLLKKFFPSAMHTAPKQLYIKNTQMRPVTLDNGDIINVVSGQIVNSSDESFSEIVVEAIAMDSAGKPLVRTKVSAANSLAGTRIKSMTPDMINDRQTEKLATHHTLKPGKTTDFAIALNNGQNTPELNDARFFTARIYLVKN